MLPKQYLESRLRKNVDNASSYVLSLLYLECSFKMSSQKAKPIYGLEGEYLVPALADLNGNDFSWHIEIALIMII